MTDQDVIQGPGQASPGQPSPSARSLRGRAGRAARLLGQHKLGTGIVALLVAAAIVGVATGSLRGTGPSPGTSSAGSSASSQASDSTIVYAHPAAAAAFTLPSLTDSSHDVSLSQYQGKPLIVNFFASWCTPCQQETPLIARFYKENGGRVTVVGIDGNDTATAGLAFARAKGVTYPVGMDQQLIIASAYNVAAFPQTFFLNSRHQVVYRVIGAVTAAELSKGAELMSKG